MNKQTTRSNPQSLHTQHKLSYARILVYPDYIDCTIYGIGKVRVKWKRARDKFILCNHENAVNFLDAMKSKKMTHLLDAQT